MRFDGYKTGRFYDELIETSGVPRTHARALIARIEELSDGDLMRRQKAAETALLHMGITFNVYSEDGDTERIFPFDLVPRVICASEWDAIERGLEQRMRALDMFIDDVYHDQKILKDKVVPSELVLGAKSFRPQCMGIDPPRQIWCHIAGTDLIRDETGMFMVLEDNMRCPSGVSYVLENRAILKRTFPQAFEEANIRPVEDYCAHLHQTIHYLAPWTDEPTAVVLTPGIYNSAYFEHSFLAREMGIELVEGSDLVVQDNRVFMRTTSGDQRVDVIYRRIDDDFLDPLAFRSDSMLGVPGLFGAFKSGNVALVNAPGNGIADDKVIYAYVPQIISYYLGEDAILPNVETFVCQDPVQRQHVLANLEPLVVKAANESGGYGMLVGPASTAAEREAFAGLINANPRDYIGQPTIALSRAPVIAGEHLEGRHIDLRPFVLQGEQIWVLPGGLTRVALKKGSLVVNSSQGGGSKDTWVIDDA